MFPYFLMIGLPAFFALLSRRSVQVTIGLALSFILFLLVIGLRYDIGPDWFAYTVHAERIPETGFSGMLSEGEVGWTLLVLFCDATGLGMQGMVFFSALGFCIGLFAIARSTQEPMLAIVSAVPYLSIAVAMSGMRQALAIGVIFYLVSRWYRTSTPVKIGVVLLAASFHFSALAMLAIVAFDSRLDLKRRVAAAALVMLIVAYQLVNTQFRVERYTRDYFGEGTAADAPGAIYHVALTAGPAIAYFVLRKRWLKIYGPMPLIDQFAAIALAALVLVVFAPTATDRMTLYFSAVALIIQANLPRLWKTPGERMLIRMGLVFLNLAAMTTFLVIGNKAKAFVPYKSVFSEEASIARDEP